MFELFPTFGSFSAFIVLLTCLAVLSIIFEAQLVEIEDKVRDAFAARFLTKSQRGKNNSRTISNKKKRTSAESNKKSNHFAA